MKRSVKLADVARAAGVSQGTASNVFAKPELVRAEVRERVEEAARRLGFAGPDPKGRLLRAGKVNAIGVIAAGAYNMASMFTGYFPSFLAGVAEICDQRGASLTLVSGVADDKTFGIRNALVDGFIIQCIEDGDRLIELARRRRLPFVAVDVDPGPDASSIMIDDRSGARMAVEHLLSLSHRQFGILSLEIASDGQTGPVDRSRRAAAQYGATRDRLLGYEDALGAAARLSWWSEQFGGYEDALHSAGIAIDQVPIIEAINDRKGAAEGARMLSIAPQTSPQSWRCPTCWRSRFWTRRETGGSGCPKTYPSSL